RSLRLAVRPDLLWIVEPNHIVMTFIPKLENCLPEMSRMESIWKLMQFAPYTALGDTEEMYIQALRENISYHYRHNDFYRNFLIRKKFMPEQLQSIADLPNVPFIHANFFKQHVVTTAVLDQVVMHATSSGTSGQKSQHFLDRWTEHVVWHIADVSLLQDGCQTLISSYYLLFNYDLYDSYHSVLAEINSRLVMYE